MRIATKRVVLSACFAGGSAADRSFRALSGRLKLTVQRYNFNEDSLSVRVTDQEGWRVREREEARGGGGRGEESLADICPPPSCPGEHRFRLARQKYGSFTISSSPRTRGKKARAWQAQEEGGGGVEGSQR